MNDFSQRACTAFDGQRRLAQGTLAQVALIAKRALDKSAAGPVLIYDDATGRVVDVDTRGSADEILARLAQRTNPLPAAAAPTSGDDEPAHGEPRGRGRPKLGVVAREVTLLPRHWEWLGTQPGGASVALRKLVDDARRASGAKDRVRAAQEAAYHFMSSMAGNLAGFEEATRALFAHDRRRFAALIAEWPQDVRDYAIKLAFADLDETAGAPQ